MSQKPKHGITKLLARADIWQGKSLAYTHTPSISSGFDDLDAALHQHGWPPGKIIELLSNDQGIGELRLLLPALAQQSQAAGITLLIAPPYIPYAPALAQQGISLNSWFILQSKNMKDSLWATEQALRSGACSAVLSWLSESGIQYRQLQRLQLAAQRHAGLCFLFRPWHCQQQASPAPLRLALQGQRQHLATRILKQPGGWAGQDVTLSIPSELKRTQLAARELPYHLRHPADSNGQDNEQLATDTYPIAALVRLPGKTKDLRPQLIH